jgi:hypothetical protein
MRVFWNLGLKHFSRGTLHLLLPSPSVITSMGLLKANFLLKVFLARGYIQQIKFKWYLVPAFINKVLLEHNHISVYPWLINHSGRTK